ncbi:hypothetical protein HMPREF3034_00274 [Prevotella sp. DNF00663]|nr:hypothetical protein HMPREF3034_00274 [Prevotella sp. DNF00663]
MFTPHHYPHLISKSYQNRISSLSTCQRIILSTTQLQEQGNNAAKPFQHR